MRNLGVEQLASPIELAPGPPDLLVEMGDKEVCIFGVTGSLNDLARMCPVDLSASGASLDAKNDFVVKAINESGGEVPSRYEAIFEETTGRLAIEKKFTVIKSDDNFDTQVLTSKDDNRVVEPIIKPDQETEYLKPKPASSVLVNDTPPRKSSSQHALYPTNLPPELSARNITNLDLEVHKITNVVKNEAVHDTTDILIPVEVVSDSYIQESPRSEDMTIIEPVNLSATFRIDQPFTKNPNLDTENTNAVEEPVNIYIEPDHINIICGPEVAEVAVDCGDFTLEDVNTVPDTPGHSNDMSDIASADATYHDTFDPEAREHLAEQSDQIRAVVYTEFIDFLYNFTQNEHTQTHIFDEKIATSTFTETTEPPNPLIELTDRLVMIDLDKKPEAEEIVLEIVAISKVLNEINSAGIQDLETEKATSRLVELCYSLFDLIELEATEEKVNQLIVALLDKSLSDHQMWEKLAIYEESGTRESVLVKQFYFPSDSQPDQKTLFWLGSLAIFNILKSKIKINTSV